MKPNPQLFEFLAPYDKHIQELVLKLRGVVIDTVSETNELIWDNYNAVAIAYSKSEQLKDAFCHIAVYSKHVNFGFNRGSELSKNAIPLKGNGKLIRHLPVTDYNSFPEQDIRKLLWEAVGLSESRNKNLATLDTTPKSIIMSISKKKLRPNQNNS